MRQSKVMLGLIICGALFCSCSVKENRMECPVYVTFLADNADQMPAAFLALAQRDGQITQKLFSKDDVVDGKCELQLPKGSWKLSLVGGVSEAVLRDANIVVDSGKQMDSLYTYIDSVVLDEDDYTVKMPLVKQYCVVAVSVSYDTQEFMDGFTLTVRGTKNGYSAFEPGTPSSGTFRCSKSEADEGPRTKALAGSDRYLFRVPRQNDTSLLLDIDDNAGGYSVSDLPLGEYIARKGYSWKAEALQDVEVSITIAKTEFGIKIVDWTVFPLDDPGTVK